MDQDQPPIARGTTSNGDDPSMAGRGAQREFERRRGRRRTRVRAKFGGLGAIATGLAGSPGHEDAWRRGAEGERRLARRLDHLLRAQPVLLFHDRKVPGGRANIDHIAVGPGGITVIDAKLLTGRVRIERRRGGNRLMVGGRDRTSMVDGVEHQVQVVRTALLDANRDDVSVVGVLCMVEPDGLPTFGALAVREIPIVGPRGAARLAARFGSSLPVGIDRVAALINSRLPPAT